MLFDEKVCYCYVKLTSFARIVFDLRLVSFGCMTVLSDFYPVVKPV